MLKGTLVNVSKTTISTSFCEDVWEKKCSDKKFKAYVFKKMLFFLIWKGLSSRNAPNILRLNSLSLLTFLQKWHLILYPKSWNSTTGIAMPAVGYNSKIPTGLTIFDCQSFAAPAAPAYFLLSHIQGDLIILSQYAGTWITIKQMLLIKLDQ